MLAARGAHLGTAGSSVADELFLAWACTHTSFFFLFPGRVEGQVRQPPTPCPPGPRPGRPLAATSMTLLGLKFWMEWTRRGFLRNLRFDIVEFS